MKKVLVTVEVELFRLGNDASMDRAASVVADWLCDAQIEGNDWTVDFNLDTLKAAPVVTAAPGSTNEVDTLLRGAMKGHALWACDPSTGGES